jgi:protein disulfide-isomerase
MRLVLGVVGVLLFLGCNVSMAEEKSAGGWLTDYDAALKKAAAENKYVLLDFSGSDWCGWCIKLDREVFSKPEFLDYAKENLILVMVDFPREKPQTKEQKAANEALSEKYDIEGFPTVLILSPAGKVVERTGYAPGGPTAYVNRIKEIIGRAK